MNVSPQPSGRPHRKRSSSRRIRRWLQSRDYHRLRWAIPALLGCLAWLAFGICLALVWKPWQIQSRYARIVGTSLAVKDFETARVASQRLMALGVGSRPKQLFDLALALGGLGREREAVALLDSMTPIDKPGYLSAHLFLAQALLTKTNVTLQEVGIVEQHLKRVIARDPQSTVANELLGRVCIRMGQWALAEKYLNQVVAARPETALLLAAVTKAQGDTTGSRSWAQRAVKFHREKVDAAKQDDPVNRLALADATAMLGDYPSAFVILEGGWRLSKNQTYLQPMGKICALWVDSLAQTHLPPSEANYWSV
jgi:tetratricopeptide (TPR) repeat protein